MVSVSQLNVIVNIPLFPLNEGIINVSIFVAVAINKDEYREIVNTKERIKKINLVGWNFSNG